MKSIKKIDGNEMQRKLKELARLKEEGER